MFGLAGARVDRIAESALANKRSIYVHFGPKETLFDFVIEQALLEMAEAVPFTAEDLPGYAGRLFDYLVKYPEVQRLVAWSGLERSSVSHGEFRAYGPKIAELAREFGDSAVDVLALALGQVTAWYSASVALREHADGDPWGTDRLARHRRLLVKAVTALVDVAHP